MRIPGRCVDEDRDEAGDYVIIETGEAAPQQPVERAHGLNELHRDGWRQGNDGLWRNDRFGGSYKFENAVQRIGSRRGERTRPETAEVEVVPALAADRLAEAGRELLKVYASPGSVGDLKLGAAVDALRAALDAYEGKG